MGVVEILSKRTSSGPKSSFLRKLPPPSLQNREQTLLDSFGQRTCRSHSKMEYLFVPNFEEIGKQFQPITHK